MLPVSGARDRLKRETPAMHAHGIAPALGVRDVRRSVAYYCDVLGFEAGPDAVFDGVDPDEGAVYGIVRCGDIAIHLQIRRRDVFAHPREDHEADAYVYVDDLDQWHERHRAAGAVIHRPPQDEIYGMRDYTVETPDGHRITFGEPR